MKQKIPIKMIKTVDCLVDGHPRELDSCYTCQYYAGRKKQTYYCDCNRKLALRKKNNTKDKKVKDNLTRRR